MKKNVMMRVASALLVAVLMTTCAISGTFAKYTTSADADDSARVAKWGVVVTATGDDAFATNYENETPGVKVVSAVVDDPETPENEAENVLAPGTKGNLGSISITGKPEVMVKITVAADLKLEGWKISEEEEYCPLVFTVGNTDIKIDGTTIKTVEALEAAVVKEFTSLSAETVDANTDLARSVSVSWRWDISTGSDEAEKAANDAKDTILGNLTGENVPTIQFECSVEVTQVD